MYACLVVDGRELAFWLRLVRQVIDVCTYVCMYACLVVDGRGLACWLRLVRQVIDAYGRCLCLLQQFALCLLPRLVFACVRDCDFFLWGLFRKRERIEREREREN